jgi:hypothetical protein
MIAAYGSKRTNRSEPITSVAFLIIVTIGL